MGNYGVRIENRDAQIGRLCFLHFHNWHLYDMGFGYCGLGVGGWVGDAQFGRLYAQIGSLRNRYFRIRYSGRDAQFGRLHPNPFIFCNWPGCVLYIIE